jgi:hypothetical protein
LGFSQNAVVFFRICCLAFRIVSHWRQADQIDQGKVRADPAKPDNSPRCPTTSGERQAFFDPGNHGLVYLSHLTEVPLPLRTLGGGQVPETGFPTENLARTGHFEPFSGRFFRLPTCN